MIAFTGRTEMRFGQVLVWMVAAAIVAAACGEAETSAQTGETSARSSNPQGAVLPGPTPLVLEFDLPTGFTDASGTVTGFRVGFFRANDPTAIRTIDVARDAVTVRDRTGSVAVARENVPPCGGDCVVRLQTLSRTQASTWSDPVPLSGPSIRETRISPRQPRPPRQSGSARPPRPRTAPPRRPIGLTPGDIEKYGSLSESLRKLLPANTNLEDELRRFRGIQELALAVVLSRDYDIPLTTLSKAMAGPPRATPRNALAQLRQDLDIPSAIRKSRAEVRRLLEMQPARPTAP